MGARGKAQERQYLCRSMTIKADPRPLAWRSGSSVCVRERHIAEPLGQNKGWGPTNPEDSHKLRLARAGAPRIPVAQEERCCPNHTLECLQISNLARPTDLEQAD